MSKVIVHEEPSLAAVGSDDCLSTDCDAMSSRCSPSASASVPEDADDCAVRHFAWISQYAPQFAVSGANVHVLTEPSDFYETLKVCSLLSAYSYIRFLKMCIGWKIFCLFES